MSTFGVAGSRLDREEDVAVLLDALESRKSDALARAGKGGS